MNRPWRLWAAVACLCAVSAATAVSAEEYPLDAFPRVVDVHAELPCEQGKITTVPYRGTLVRYQTPARVHPAFRAKLQAFEEVVVSASLHHYGRPPRRLVHLGTYNCRRMRRYPSWQSEHAFANGIDLAGLDFGPLPAASSADTALPAKLRRGFQVRIERHWGARSGVASLHDRFLRDLAARLVDRRDIFHVLLGPGWPGHHNHFHLDRAPYRVVEGFAE